MPILVAPIAGLMINRVGSRVLLATGMVLMSIALAWIAAIASPTVEYLTMALAFVIAGTGMSLFFALTANLILSAVRPDEEGLASGANNTIREVGGVFGVAILASVFSATGGYGSPQAFVDGLVPPSGSAPRSSGSGRSSPWRSRREAGSGPRRSSCRRAPLSSVGRSSHRSRPASTAESFLAAGRRRPAGDRRLAELEPIERKGRRFPGDSAREHLAGTLRTALA